MSRDRAAVTRKLAGLELPEAFRLATVASEARILTVPRRERTTAQIRDLRRISSQARRVA